jgi:glycine oxidase
MDMRAAGTDCVIIGGGVIGLAIARELKKRGVGKIAVVDRGPVGREASWAAAGMLAPNLECESVDEFHRFCAASLALYPRFAAELLDETGGDIELDRTGTLYLAFEEDEGASALEKYRRQRAAGIAVERVSPEEVLKLEPLVSPKVQFGLFYPGDWQVENRKLVKAFEAFCRREGVNLVENVAAEKIILRDGRAVGVEAAAGTIFADQVIVAAGAWTSMIGVEGRGLKFPVKPVRGQMIAYRGEPGRFRHVIYSHRGYVVPRADGRILVGATVEDVGFEKATTAAGVKSLEVAAAEISPFVPDREPRENWSGLRPFAADGLPVIGPVPGIEGLFVATGHFRNGILLAPITAQITAEFVVRGTDSEYFSHFGPQRFAAASKTSARTNI